MTNILADASATTDLVPIFTYPPGPLKFNGQETFGYMFEAQSLVTVQEMIDLCRLRLLRPADITLELATIDMIEHVYLTLFQQLANLHQAGFVIRNMDPEAFAFVTRKPRAGVNTDPKLTLTRIGSLARTERPQDGTEPYSNPRYIAPEVLVEHLNNVPSADLFGLHQIMAEFLGADPVYQKDSVLFLIAGSESRYNERLATLEGDLTARVGEALSPEARARLLRLKHTILAGLQRLPSERMTHMQRVSSAIREDQAFQGSSAEAYVIPLHRLISPDSSAASTHQPLPDPSTVRETDGALDRRALADKKAVPIGPTASELEAWRADVAALPLRRDCSTIDR